MCNSWSPQERFSQYANLHTYRYKMNESDVRDAVASALQLVNMQDYIFRATHTLSGGQRQRIAIAGRW